MFDQALKVTTQPNGDIVFDVGFGITYTMTAANKAAYDRGMALAAQTQPEFLDQLAGRKVPELKVLAQKVRPRAGLRGLTTRKDFTDVLVQWHTSECLKAAGYVDSRR